jgi:hypothetical protein
LEETIRAHAEAERNTKIAMAVNILTSGKDRNEKN